MKIKKTNRIIRKHNKNLAEAALYDFLHMIEYKCKWYGTELIQLGQYEPTTIECFDCGYKIKSLPVNKREWNCPNCGKHHKRDLNAAKVGKKKIIQIHNNIKAEIA